MKTKLLTTALLVAVGVAGPAASAFADDCDRECILGVTDAYLSALAAGDVDAAPLAEGAAFVENVTRLQPGAGLWQSVTGGPTDFSIHVPDPVLQAAGWLGMMERDGVPVMVAVHLQLDGRQISAVEHIVTTVTEERLPRVQTPRPGLLAAVPEHQRLPHSELIRIGASYYDALDDNDGSLAPFADDCQRHENGMVTAGAEAEPGPDFDPNQPHIARECAAQLDSQAFIYIDRIENRRMIAADPVTGLSMGLSHFRHPMDNLPYTVTRVDGSTSERNSENMPFDPFDMPAAHIYKIGPEGMIHEIEAAGVSVPYNSPTGWE